MKYFILLLILTFLAFILYVEKRNFYCLESGNCVTVWKTINKNCYIIPDKYYGLFLPQDNYLKTPSTNNLTIFFSTTLPHSFVYRSEQVLEIYNKRNGNQFTFHDFFSDSKKFDSILYLPGSKKNNDVRTNVQLIDIFLNENAAIDGKGKKL